MTWDQERFHTVYKLADALAEYALAGLTDKQGKPLIDHCRRVASKCWEAGLSQEQIVTGLLHDVVEENLSDRVKSGHLLCTVDWFFGANVYSQVWSITRTPRKGTYENYIKSITLDAIPVKIIDIDDNLDESRGSISESLRKRYLKAKSLLEEILSRA